MATNTIGLGQDYATLSDWANYINALGPLTEDEIGLVTNDSVYSYDSSRVLSFGDVTDNGFDIILRGSGAGKHTGDYGTGAVLSGNANFTVLYRPSNLVMEDLEFENTGADAFAVLEPTGCIGRRLLIRAPNANKAAGRGLRILAVDTANRFEACRITGCQWGIRDEKGTTSGLAEFVNLTIESCGVGVLVTATGNSSYHNIVTTSTCDSSWVATGAFLDSSCSNNASFDGAQPGVNGVTLSGDPFEADGYTPSVGGLLDGAGSTTYTVTDDAASRLFNSPPSIGAYEVPNTVPTIIDVDGDEIIVDGQTNLRIVLEQYTTAPNKVSLRKVSSPSLETLTSNLTSGIDSATFDLPDISQYATDTTGVPFTSLSHSILLRAENDSEQDDISVAYNPKSGYAVTEVFSSSQLEGSVFQNFSGAPSDGSQVYYPTAFNTSVDSQGFLFTDATNDIDMQFWDIGDNTWKQFSVLIGLPEFPTSGTISFSDLRREFDSTGSEVRISDFYRGGSFVPNTSTNLGVPTSGEIRISDFYGASDSASPFAFANATGGSPDYTSTAPRPTSGACRAEFEIQTDGDIARFIDLTADATGAEQDIGDWISPKSFANASDFQFRVGDRTGTDPSRTGSAVTIPTGAIASQSWNNLSSNVNYYLGVDGTSDTTTFSFQLRYIPTSEESPVSDVTITANGTGA